MISGMSSSAVWILDHANGLGGTATWQQLPVSGPAPRQNHQAVYYSRTNRMIVFSFAPQSMLRKAFLNLMPAVSVDICRRGRWLCYQVHLQIDP